MRQLEGHDTANLASLYLACSCKQAKCGYFLKEQFDTTLYSQTEVQTQFSKPAAPGNSYCFPRELFLTEWIAVILKTHKIWHVCRTYLEMKVDTMDWVEKVGCWYLIPSSLLAALTKELEGSQKAVDRGFLEGPSTTATAHFGGQRGRKTCSETGPLWIWRPIVSLDNHICCWQDYLALPWEPFFGRNIERYIVDRHITQFK